MMEKMENCDIGKGLSDTSKLSSKLTKLGEGLSNIGVQGSGDRNQKSRQDLGGAFLVDLNRPHYPPPHCQTAYKKRILEDFCPTLPKPAKEARRVPQAQPMVNIFLKKQKSLVDSHTEVPRSGGEVERTPSHMRGEVEVGCRPTEVPRSGGEVERTPSHMRGEVEVGCRPKNMKKVESEDSWPALPAPAKSGWKAQFGLKGGAPPNRGEKLTDMGAKPEGLDKTEEGVPAGNPRMKVLYECTLCQMKKNKKKKMRKHLENFHGPAHLQSFSPNRGEKLTAMGAKPEGLDKTEEGVTAGNPRMKVLYKCTLCQMKKNKKKKMRKHLENFHGPAHLQSFSLEMIPIEEKQQIPVVEEKKKKIEVEKKEIDKKGKDKGKLKKKGEEIGKALAKDRVEVEKRLTEKKEEKKKRSMQGRLEKGDKKKKKLAFEEHTDGVEVEKKNKNGLAKPLQIDVEEKEDGVEEEEKKEEDKGKLKKKGEEIGKKEKKKKRSMQERLEKGDKKKKGLAKLLQIDVEEKVDGVEMRVRKCQIKLKKLKMQRVNCCSVKVKTVRKSSGQASRPSKKHKKHPGDYIKLGITCMEDHCNQSMKYYSSYERLVIFINL